MREREAEVLDRARVSLLPPPLLWRRRRRPTLAATIQELN